MKAIKQKSGRWRVQVYSHTEIVDGKEKLIRKSFTADTKKEALKMATDFLTGERHGMQADMTVGEAVDGYIAMKSNVLSPTTINSYKQIKRCYFAPIERIKLEKLTQIDVQKWVNSIAKDHSPKTVKNAHGLLTACVTAYLPDKQIKTRLPQKKPIDYKIPSEDEIKEIIWHLKDTEELKAVLLAAFGTLRRGEICALTGHDINGNVVSIRKSMVRIEKDYVVKTTKTVGSNRDVSLPEWVIEIIKPSDPDKRVCDLTPAAVSKRFDKALKDLCLPHYRFHDLRHFAASYMMNNGIPEFIVQQRGGWENPTMIRKVYAHSMKEYVDQYNDVINEKLTASFEKK